MITSEEIEALRKSCNPDGSDLRILQLKLLEILKIVTCICDEHEIPYWLSGGTLLGAKMYGGFIPWDDDIDIEILREDYLKLLPILEEQLPKHLCLQTPKEKGVSILLSKVRDRYSVIHSDEENDAIYDEKGIFIDIVPLERSYRRLKNVVDFFYGRSFRRIKRGRPMRSPKIFFEYAAALLLFVPSLLLLKGARLFTTITKPQYIYHCYGMNGFPARKLDDMFPLSVITFEKQELSAPKDIDKYLFDQFGSGYTKVYPEELRPKHFISVEYLD